MGVSSENSYLAGGVTKKMMSALECDGILFGTQTYGTTGGHPLYQRAEMTRYVARRSSLLIHIKTVLLPQL